jgi:hypothetical protein
MNNAIRTHLYTIGAVAAICLGVHPSSRAGTIHIRYEIDAPDKYAHANIHYYQSVVRTFDHCPVLFEHEHPFYTRLLENQSFMESIVRRWQSHEQRFEYWHPSLWRFLDGYQYTHIPGQCQPIETFRPPSSDRTPGQVPAGPDSSNAVQEPSTGFLMVVSTCAGAMLLKLGHRRS